MRRTQLLVGLMFGTIGLSLVATAVTAQDNSGPAFFVFAYFVGLLLLVIAFPIPSIVAFWRRHPNRWIILVINIVFGATLLGWLIALVWAMRAVHISPIGSDGGESGLNLGVNDPLLNAVMVHPVEGGPAERDVVGELQKLKGLLDSGAIDEVEFKALKQDVLNHGK